MKTSFPHAHQIPATVVRQSDTVTQAPVAALDECQLCGDGRTVIDFRQELALRPAELPGLNFEQPDAQDVQDAKEQLAKLRLRNLRGDGGSAQ